MEDEVLINDRAWREATPAFREAGGDLTTCCAPQGWPLAHERAAARDDHVR